MDDVVNYHIIDECLNSMDFVDKNTSGAFVSLQKEDEKFEEICKKVINYIAELMKQMAEVPYKLTPFLEPSDVEQIKNNLKQYRKKNKRVNNFKDSLIVDLSEFQKQIVSNHAQRIRELKNEKTFLERQIKVLEYSKSRLVMERLANIQWPYDAKTKEYDTKIAALQLKAQNHAKNIVKAQSMRPSATLKDILIYQMQLKEKYNVK